MLRTFVPFSNWVPTYLFEFNFKGNCLMTFLCNWELNQEKSGWRVVGLTYFERNEDKRETHNRTRNNLIEVIVINHFIKAAFSSNIIIILEGSPYLFNETYFQNEQAFLMVL